MRVFSFFKQTKQLGPIRTGTLERFARGKNATRPNLIAIRREVRYVKSTLLDSVQHHSGHDRSIVAERRLFVPDRCPIIISSTNSRAPAAPACLKHIDVGHRQGWEA